MTTELEQKFYDTFGIEKKCNRETLKFCTGGLDCNTCESPFYSKITAEKLLEMICVLNKHYAENFQCATMLVGDTIERIKECILKDCIEQSQHIKSNIQQLFKD